ncbi:MAG: hypothetical protein ACXV29_11380 [Halobacteriota archaeon]
MFYLAVLTPAIAHQAAKRTADDFNRISATALYGAYHDYDAARLAECGRGEGAAAHNGSMHENRKLIIRATFPYNKRVFKTVVGSIFLFD